MQAANNNNSVFLVLQHTFLTPPVAGALFLAALVASCLRGALPPVDLRAVCLVRAMMEKVAQDALEGVKREVVVSFASSSRPF